MKTLLYANRAEPKYISVISILLLAAVGAITKLRCMHRECYIFASQNLHNINFVKHQHILITWLLVLLPTCRKYSNLKLCSIKLTTIEMGYHHTSWKLA